MQNDIVHSKSSESTWAYMAGLGCELRTALTLILGPLLTLLSDESIHAGGKRDLNRIHRNANRLLKAADHFLMLSELESGTLHTQPQPTHLPSVLLQTMDDLKNDAAQRSIVFSPQIHEIKAVSTDHHLMCQVLSMLLKYIVEETQQESMIQITVRERCHQAELLISYNRESALAEPNQKPNSLWDLGLQNTNKMRGLSLALTGGILKRLNAETRLDTAPGGQQTQLVLYLPLTKSSPLPCNLVNKSPTCLCHNDIPEKTPPIEDPEKNAHLPQVLLISEQGTLNRYIHELLSGRFRVVKTSASDHLADLIREVKPEVVLFDCLESSTQNLPFDDISETIPIIAMLPHQGTTCPNLARLHDYIYKPFEPERFRQRVQNASELYRLRMDRTAWMEERKYLKDQVRESASRAGIAEMATGILHNVGNVLNNVNVSAGLIEELIRKMKISCIGRAAGLLEEHIDNPDTCKRKETMGKLVEYFAAIDTRLSNEQALVQKEAHNLRNNVEHVHNIIGLQQKLARKTGSIEIVTLEQLMNDALEINAVVMSQGDIEIICESVSTKPISIDKHKALQILANLLSNARHALAERKLNGKKILFRGEPMGEHHFVLSVYDNGIGIPKENLKHIFSHGFTTKEKGFGFGLHASLIAAEEMGGFLTCESEGRNRGATFKLQLPNKPPFSS